MQIALSHVAVLLPDIRKAAAQLTAFKVESEQIFEGEGTREIYVELKRANALLLMEPVKAGSYRRALETRGPGVHHFAIDVLDIEAYLASIAGSGWMMHLNSVETLKKVRTAYLLRPGFPGLIEVQEKSELSDGTPFVEQVRLPLKEEFLKLLPAVGLEGRIEPSNDVQIVLSGQSFSLENWLK